MWPVRVLRLMPYEPTSSSVRCEVMVSAPRHTTARAATARAAREIVSERKRLRAQGSVPGSHARCGCVANFQSAPPRTDKPISR